MYSREIKEFKKMIEESNDIVFLGGAGVSTESNIPDFRSTDGIYNEKYLYPPEVILSHTFFENNTEEFYKFYRDKMIYLDAKPNITHKVLKRLEEEGKLSAIITQNIDGLHQMAGSKNVLELHGSIMRNHCVKCKKFYSLQDVIKGELIPKCSCLGIIKPDVVLYEEALDEDTLRRAIISISHCDMLIIAGTSLKVFPAAGLMDYYRGSKLVIINKEKTEMDNKANLVIYDKLGNVFSKI